MPTLQKTLDSFPYSVNRMPLELDYPTPGQIPTASAGGYCCLGFFENKLKLLGRFLTPPPFFSSPPTRNPYLPELPLAKHLGQCPSFARGA